MPPRSLSRSQEIQLRRNLEALSIRVSSTWRIFRAILARPTHSRLSARRRRAASTTAVGSMAADAGATEAVAVILQRPLEVAEEVVAVAADVVDAAVETSTWA